MEVHKLESLNKGEFFGFSDYDSWLEWKNRLTYEYELDKDVLSALKWGFKTNKNIQDICYSIRSG